MTDLVTQICVWLNRLANPLGRFLLGWVGSLPGWLSNTLISAVAGLVFLLLFKRTSNQQAIGRIRNQIKANVLAMKLFKDSLSVTFTSQMQLYKGSLLLLSHAILPMLVMIVPVALLLGQLSGWYQASPLKPADETVVTMTLAEHVGDVWPEVTIQSMPGADVLIGPVRVTSKRQIHWKIKATEPGDEPIVFKVNQGEITKQLAVSNDWKRVSPVRPPWQWTDVLLYPCEAPFRPDSPVQSIRIDYPDRHSPFSGTESWLIYFFVASMVFALVWRPVFNVKI